MKTAREIIGFVGRTTLAAKLQVKEGAIDQALHKGILPAGWYHACEQLAGRPLPRECFSFKGLDK